MLRTEIMLKLLKYNYTEIQQAREIISESEKNKVNINDLRRVWDRISVAIDHHIDDDNPLTELIAFEKNLSDATSQKKCDT